MGFLKIEKRVYIIMALKSNLREQQQTVQYDARLDDLELLQQFPWKVYMVPTPRTFKIRFVDFEESQSDEESSEIRIEKKIKERTTEKWSDAFRILIARQKIKIKKKKKKTEGPKVKIEYNFLLGIEFPNGHIVYQKTEIRKNDLAMFAISKRNNILLHIPVQGKLFMGLIGMGRCNICNIRLKRLYRCYDCEPKKQKTMTDFCKACYIKREHAGHRAIVLNYDEDLFDDYPYLDE